MADTRSSMNLGGDAGAFAANLKRATDSVIPSMNNLKNIVQNIVTNLNTVGAKNYGGGDNTNKVAQGAPPPPPIGPLMANGQFNNNGGGNRVALSAAGGLVAAQLVSNALPGTNQLIQQDLLTNRAKAMGFGGGNYNNVTNMQNQFNRMGTVTDQMDATRALSYAKAAGLAAPNFSSGANNNLNANTVMAGVAQMSNITPGLGLTGGLQAYGAIQQGKSVNNLLGIGIRVRNQDGSMVNFNEIVDQLWNKINREKVGSAPLTSSDLDIMLEPGNGLARLLDFYFGQDAGLRATIQTALYVKVENNGKALGTISKTTLKNQGFTTKAINSLSERTSRAARVSALSAPSAAAGFTAANDTASALSRLADAVIPLIDVFTGLSTAIKGIAGIGGGLIGNILSLIPGVGPLFKREAGGPVTDRVPYIVGEKGPELFVPKTSGTIIPNHIIGRAGGGNVDAKGFATMLLSGLGAKATPEAINDVMFWEGKEGGNWHNTAKFNPLNTSYTLPGSTNFNTKKSGGGVQAYTSWDQGLQATIGTLTGKNAKERGYTAIVDFLKKGGGSTADMLKIMQNSQWDAGKYGGAGGSSSSAPASATTTSNAPVNAAEAANMSTLQNAGAFNSKSTGGTNITINLTGSMDSTANALAIKKALSDPTITIGKS
jgi:hypothetical protein